MNTLGESGSERGNSIAEKIMKKLGLPATALVLTSCADFQKAVESASAPGSVAARTHAVNGHGQYASDKPGHRNDHAGAHLGHIHPKKGVNGMTEGSDREVIVVDANGNTVATLENTAPSPEPAPRPKPGELKLKKVMTRVPKAAPVKVAPKPKTASQPVSVQQRTVSAASSSKATISRSPEVVASKIYTVQSGDTAGDIAIKLGLQPGMLSNLNPTVKDWNRLLPGQILQVSR